MITTDDIIKDLCPCITTHKICPTTARKPLDMCIHVINSYVQKSPTEDHCWKWCSVRSCNPLWRTRMATTVLKYENFSASHDQSHWDALPLTPSSTLTGLSIGLEARHYRLKQIIPLPISHSFNLSLCWKAHCMLYIHSKYTTWL